SVSVIPPLEHVLDEPDSARCAHPRHGSDPSRSPVPRRPRIGRSLAPGQSSRELLLIASRLSQRAAKLCWNRLPLKQRVPLLPAPAFPALLVIRIARDQRQRDRRLAVDHLLVNRVHLAPAARFFQRAAR